MMYRVRHPRNMPGDEYSCPDKALDRATTLAKQHPGTPIEVVAFEAFATVVVPDDPEPIISWAKRPPFAK